MKMVHNGIEYGDMQLISEAYEILKQVGGLTNEEPVETFSSWNSTELEYPSSLRSLLRSLLQKMTSLVMGKLCFTYIYTCVCGGGES